MTGAPTALVTGAGRGIGAATVRALVRDGWQVVAIDRAADEPTIPYPLASDADLVQVAADANALAGDERVITHVADVRDIAALAESVSLAEQRWGGVDAAVACAAVIAGGAPHAEVPLEQESALLDITLHGVLNLARVAVPAMLRRPVPRNGRFVAVASAAATRGLPMLAAYCAAKAGVAGFVRALAVELACTGVTANAISPGSTATAMLDETARLYLLESRHAFGQPAPLAPD